MPSLQTRYTAYNLSFQSDLQIPEFLSDSNKDASPPDVRILYGEFAEDGIHDGKQIGPFLWVNRDTLWLKVPHVARFLVTDGNTILIAPESGIDEESIRVFLLGSALGALLFQRGYLVMHGNAIRIGNHCMLCVGHSGTGKSTLAAGFLRRGYQVLADDVVPIDANCCAVPGFPRIKLWQDVTDKLEIDTSTLFRIRPNMEKFNYPLLQNFGEEPLPVKWVYILGIDNDDDVSVDPIQGMQRFQPLHNNTYRVRFLEGMALKPTHLTLCGQLAGRIRLAHVTRPRSGFKLDMLIDRILLDIEENP